MAKESSIAPKERVNITYKPATGVDEEVELPLRVMVMGDFTLKEDETILEEREADQIDKDNFNDVLKGKNINLQITVPDKLGDDPDGQLDVSLKLDHMNKFKPDEIVNQVPEMQKLLELRESLKALKAPLGNVPAFRKKIQEIVQDEETKKRLLSELGIKE